MPEEVHEDVVGVYLLPQFWRYRSTGRDDFFGIRLQSGYEASGNLDGSGPRGGIIQRLG